MTMAKNIRCTTILTFAFGICTSLIKGIASEDVQVLVNDSVVISCFPNRALKVQWHHTSPGKSIGEYAYAGGKFYSPYDTGRFRVDNDPIANIYTLVIANVTLGDAGLYECKDDASSGVFGSTQLIILNSGPVCNSNMHPDGFVGPNKCDLQKENMTFSCSVSFAGRISPSLIWRTVNDSQSLNDSSCITQSNHINCSLTLTTDPEYDGSVFICETKASNGGRFNCSTEVVKVQYFSADFENSNKKVRDNVSCIVRSNLETRYNWKIERNNQSFFLSSERMIIMKESGIYRCDVEYSIGNNTCSFLTYAVNATMVPDSSDSEKEKDYVLAIALSIFFSIALLAVIAAFVVYAKCFKNKSKKQYSMERMNDSDESVPMIVRRQTRLDKIRPRLTEICASPQIGTQLIGKLKVLLPDITEDFDYADAADDSNTRSERLLGVISDRVDETFDPFRQALAEINPALGNYIEKGEIIAVEITTAMPDLDEPLSEAFNVAVINKSELFMELTTYAITMVIAKPSNSIEVLMYCGEPEDMRKFIVVFNSGDLERLLSDVLKTLLSNIHSSNDVSLDAKVYMPQKEVILVEKFADQQDWLRVTGKIRMSPPLIKDPCEEPLIWTEEESKNQPSCSYGQIADTSDENDIGLITPTPKESKKENVSGITESNWKEILRSNYADLLVKINSNNDEEGLQGEFRKLNLFSPLTIKSIWGYRSNIEKNKAILSLLERGDLERFLAVRSALEKSRQEPLVKNHLSHIKSHLPTPDNRYNEPLKESYRYQLLFNWNQLLVDINYDEGLSSRLKARRTLTDYQTAFLEDLPTDTCKLNYLLRLLETGSQQHFDDFCECLKANNQEHIVNKYLTLKSVNTDLDDIPKSFKDVRLQLSIKTRPIKGRVFVISNAYYLNQTRSEMSENEMNLNIFFEDKLLYQRKPILDETLVRNETAQKMMKMLETEQQNPKDYDVFLMFLFSFGNSREIFTKDGQSVKIDDLFDMFDGVKCPKLEGRPKLFIIQTFERDGSSDSPSLDAEGKLSVSFNLKNDMTVVYATVKGEPETGREETGTLFLRCLLKVFFSKIQEMDFKTMIDDVLLLLPKMDQKITLPNEEVQTVQQLAAFQTTITEKVFLVEQR